MFKCISRHLADLRLKFPNEPSLDFDDVSDKNPAQEFEVAVGRDVGEYTVRHVYFRWSGCGTRARIDNRITDRATKFTNVTSVTLFIPSNQGADSTRLYYIGFLGHWTQVRGISSLICLNSHRFHGTPSGRVILS